MWSDFTDSPTEVPNIAALASVLVDLFTIGAKMRKHSFNSVLFARTANNESLNNMYALWTTKATHNTVSAHLSVAYQQVVVRPQELTPLVCCEIACNENY